MRASRIRAEVEVPSHVIIPRGRKKVEIEAVALIHNDSEEHFVLGTDDGAQVHSWQILDEGSREVARVGGGAIGKVKGASMAYRSTLVPSNLCLREHEVLSVDASKLKDGRLYTVRHTHWGQCAEAQFVAVLEPARAKKKATKKAASKSTKKSAKSKSTKKKRARKGAKK